MVELRLRDKILAVERALSAASIEHAFGGAISLSYYAEPRATVDVDCNVFVPVDHWRSVTDALAAVGVDTRLDAVALARDGQVRLWWGANPVDLFFSHDAFHDAMAERTRRVPFAGEWIPILGPEHLVVCKAVFDRRKDWLDIEQVLVCVEGFDADEARAWLVRIVGPEDPRFLRLDELAGRFLGR